MRFNKHNITDVVRTSLGRLPEPHVYRSLEDADRYRKGHDSRQTVILPDRVIKRQDPASACIEAEKSRRGALIGQECGWFQSPQIIASTLEAGEIQFERLEDVVPLWDVLRRDDDATDVLERSGRSLASIHNSLQLPSGMSFPTTLDRRNKFPVVCLHGDFTVFNVLVEPATKAIWLIDWMTSQAARHGVGTTGPCYFDIAWFVRSMLTQRYFGLARIREIHNKVDAFIAAYSEESVNPCTIDEFQAYLTEVFQPYVLSSLRFFSPSPFQILRPILGYPYVARPAWRDFARLYTRSSSLADSEQCLGTSSRCVGDEKTK